MFSKLSKEAVKKRIYKLRQSINHHRYLYHVLDKQEISDEALDSLKKELFDLEQEFPELVTKDSPTQRIGGKPLKEFSKIKHPHPMLSFNDVFDEEEMKEWETRFEKIFPGAKKNGYYCELKIDGLAIELTYKKGALLTGSTRGDGLIGENVTQNLKTIDAIPLIIKEDREVTIRGEVFITKKSFEKINKNQEKAGLKIYANPRNLAAGSVRQLNPKITASRNPDSFAYSLVTNLGQKTHEEEHQILKNLGFKINPHNKFAKDLNEVQKFRDYWEKHRDKLNYEIDGIVVILNDEKAFKKTGVVGKAPRGAIAYKFSPKEAETIIEDIIIQVGRTGALTPVAVLRPVKIGGTTVSRATLHNLDEIRRLGIKIKDTVIVGRAGDVIPNITKVLKEFRTGKEKDFHMPKTCPVCESLVKQIENKVAFKCSNENCPAKKREGVYHFVSKKALDIDGVGPKIIDQLMSAALITDAADLFNLKKEDFLNLERFAEKSADNAIKAIQSKKEVPLHKFIFSLGLPNVGEETAYALANKFHTLENIEKASERELAVIHDIGPIIAKNVSEWFQKIYNKKLISKFKKAGIRILELKPTEHSKKLEGKIFVLTGSMESLTRDEAKEKIRKFGGDISSTVSQNTDYIVAGSESGSKHEKAIKLGKKIINEKEFLDLLK